MRVEHQVGAALLLDCLLGDPRWLPHPVRAMGALAQSLEGPLRRGIRPARLAGAAAVLLVVASSAGAACLLLALAARVGGGVRDAVGVLLLYTTFAGRDLAGHAMDVFCALRKDDLGRARQLTSRMVGRDTDKLDEHGVIRAVVESVAENTVDGVTAPLFFALLGGPVAAIAYKAASTLDSTFGYRNERYLQFGWASARLDDLLAYLPARLTLPVMTAAAALVGLRPAGALRCGLRDGQKHASPNSGISEATAAGALGVQLGGALSRQGKLCDAPTMGDAVEPLARKHIRQVVALMAMTALLFYLAGWALRSICAL